MIGCGTILVTYGQTAIALLLGKLTLAMSVVPAALFVMGVVEHYQFSALQRELDLKAQVMQQRQQQRQQPPVVAMPATSGSLYGENTSLLQKQT